MRPHGHATVDPTNPQAFAVCDRCGMWHRHRDLKWQYEYRGRKLENTRWLVCDRCLDEPQAQLKAIIVGPDPKPIQNPRPELADMSQIFYVLDESGNPIVLEDGGFLIMEDE